MVPPVKGKQVYELGFSGKSCGSGLASPVLVGTTVVVSYIDRGGRWSDSTPVLTVGT